MRINPDRVYDATKLLALFSFLNHNGVTCSSQFCKLFDTLGHERSGERNVDGELHLQLQGEYRGGSTSQNWVETDDLCSTLNGNV